MGYSRTSVEVKVTVRHGGAAAADRRALVFVLVLVLILALLLARAVALAAAVVMMLLDVLDVLAPICAGTPSLGEETAGGAADGNGCICSSSESSLLSDLDILDVDPSDSSNVRTVMAETAEPNDETEHLCC